MRRNSFGAAVAVAGLTASILGGCGEDSDRITDAFASCIREGGGRITGEVDLVISEGKALAVVGPGVDADDALLSRCLDRASIRS